MCFTFSNYVNFEYVVFALDRLGLGFGFGLFLQDWLLWYGSGWQCRLGYLLFLPYNRSNRMHACRLGVCLF